MWAPGTYLPDRGEGEAVHANIGVEKYFFEAGDRILNRIKEQRGTVILPERTGPIADVLYSAAGQQRRRALVQPRRHRVQLRDGRRPVRQHVAVRRFGGRRDRRPAGEPERLRRRRQDQDRRRDRERGGPRRRLRRGVEPAEPAAERHADPALSLAHASGAVVAGGTSRGRRLPAGLRDRGQAGGARVRGRQLRAPRVGARVRAGRHAARGDDDRPDEVEGADHDDVRVGERAVGDPLHDGRVEAERELDALGLHRAARAGRGVPPHETTTFKWIATDIKGNTSTGSQKFQIKP